VCCCDINSITSSSFYYQSMTEWVKYGKSDSTKSLASGIATVGEPRLMSHVGSVRKVVYT